MYVCEVAVAEEAALEEEEEDVSLIAMAEDPRTVGGKVFTPQPVLVTSTALIRKYVFAV